MGRYGQKFVVNFRCIIQVAQYLLSNRAVVAQCKQNEIQYQEVSGNGQFAFSQT